MSKAYEFLKEYGIFYVLTVNGDYPAGRPFGGLMKVRSCRAIMSLQNRNIF